MNERLAPTIARTSLVLLSTQLVFRGVEAAFPVLLAIWFGRDDRTDVYYFGWAIFALAGSVVFSAFQDSAVVPILTELKAKDPASLPTVRGSLYAHTLVFGAAAATAVGALAAGWFALRYSGAERGVALLLIVPLSLYLIALAAKTFYASILNAEHRYAAAPVATAAGALATIGAIAVLRRPLSVVAIPCGSLLGEVVATAGLAAAARHYRVFVAPTLARPAPVRRVARLVASEVAGGAVTRLNPVIDQLFAGLLGVAGGGTLLKLSGDVASVPTSLLQSALLPVLLTHWSEDFASGDIVKMRAAVRRALGVVVALLVASSAALAWVRRPLLSLVLAHGAMDSAGVERIAHVLPYHLVGLAPFGALLVLSRAHVAAQNSRIMVSMGVLNAAFNAVLDVTLMPVLGLEGLALATSGTHAIVALVFFARFESLAASASRDHAAVRLGA